MLIQKYNPIWIDNFEKIKTEIQKALFDIEIKIEHIGSTSVIGLSAKPIICLLYTSPSPRDRG